MRGTLKTSNIIFPAQAPLATRIPPPILIIDGVTGAGKTSVVTELRSRMPPTVEFILEDDTLGDLMDLIRDPLWRAQPTFAALDSVLLRLEGGIANANDARFVVERFHLTAFALFPQWEYYQTYDERLGKLGAAMVLLTFPPRTRRGAGHPAPG